MRDTATLPTPKDGHIDGYAFNANAWDAEEMPSLTPLLNK